MSEMIRFSLSSEEDVYDFLNKLSFIYEGKQKDIEMMSIYHRFEELVGDVPNNRYITIYHDVQIGKVNSKKRGSVVKTCSELLGIEEEEFEVGLDLNVKDVVRLNLEKWREYINQRYKNVYFEKELAETPRASSIVSISSLEEIDKELKNKLKSKDVLTHREEGQKNDDLADLISYEKELEESIDELIKQGKRDTQECRKLVTTRVQVRKDINIIKRFYGEVLGKQNSHGRTSFTYYDHENKDYRYIIEVHETQLDNLEQDQLDEYIKEEKIKNIKKVAKNILTNRQYIIFELYYFNDLTQQEIADLMGIPRPNVTRELGTIIKKIKRNGTF